MDEKKTNASPKEIAHTWLKHHNHDKSQDSSGKHDPKTLLVIVLVIVVCVSSMVLLSTFNG